MESGLLMQGCNKHQQLPFRLIDVDVFDLVLIVVHDKFLI
jgi:hypothetical protein